MNCTSQFVFFYVVYYFVGNRPNWFFRTVHFKSSCCWIFPEWHINQRDHSNTYYTYRSNSRMWEMFLSLSWTFECIFFLLVWVVFGISFDICIWMVELFWCIMTCLRSNCMDLNFCIYVIRAFVLNKNRHLYSFKARGFEHVAGCIQIYRIFASLWRTWVLVGCPFAILGR